MVRGRLAAGALLIMIGAACAYGSTLFVFNPFTYRTNDVTNMPWSFYRGPLQVEYGVLEEGGWRFARIVDTAEARALFRELSRSSLGHSEHEAAADSFGRHVWFGVRRVSDGAVLLDAKGREGGDTFLLRGQVAVSVTPALLELLSARLPLHRQ